MGPFDWGQHDDFVIEYVERLLEQYDSHRRARRGDEPDDVQGLSEIAEHARALLDTLLGLQRPQPGTNRPPATLKILGLWSDLSRLTSDLEALASAAAFLDSQFHPPTGRRKFGRPTREPERLLADDLAFWFLTYYSGPRRGRRQRLRQFVELCFRCAEIPTPIGDTFDREYLAPAIRRHNGAPDFYEELRQKASAGLHPYQRQPKSRHAKKSAAKA
jgi:hypothetical protein